MAYGFKDNHARNGFPVFLLFGSVDAVCGLIDRKAMDCVLNMEVLKLSVVIGIVLVKDGNRSAVASYVDPAQARIELDDVRAARHR